MKSADAPVARRLWLVFFPLFWLHDTYLTKISQLISPNCYIIIPNMIASRSFFSVASRKDQILLLEGGIFQNRYPIGTLNTEVGPPGRNIQEQFYYFL